MGSQVFTGGGGEKPKYEIAESLTTKWIRQRCAAGAIVTKTKCFFKQAWGHQFQFIFAQVSNNSCNQLHPLPHEVYSVGTF